MGEANREISPSSAAIVYPNIQPTPGTVISNGTYGWLAPSALSFVSIRAYLLVNDVDQPYRRLHVASPGLWQRQFGGQFPAGGAEET
ncbi:MAG TPA: hypothetical protein VMV09_05365 [Candidatus Saccharimonadales bacterium]|nr:hypothetical protein [Candidatus Saccharimonadales bacterium]